MTHTITTLNGNAWNKDGSNWHLTTKEGRILLSIYYYEEAREGGLFEQHIPVLRENPQYLHYVRDFCEHLQVSNMTGIGGFAIDTDGNRYIGEVDILNAPDGTVFRNANITYTQSIHYWRHSVTGNFDALNCYLKTVADHVVFGGNVCIQGSSVEVWRHRVPGYFDASYSWLKEIADTASFGGGYDVSNTVIEDVAVA